MTVLLIQLKNDYICVCETSAMELNGYLCLKQQSNDSINDSNSNSDRFQLVKSSLPLAPSHTILAISRWKDTKIDNNLKAVMTKDIVYRLSVNDWQYDCLHHQFILHFNLPLPKDIPITYNSNDGSVQYSLEATVNYPNSDDLHAHSSLFFFHGSPPVSPSTSSFSLSSTSSTFSLPSFLSESSIDTLSSIGAHQSRLCWGVSDHSQWQYELELPQLIHSCQPFILTLRTRMRSFSHYYTHYPQSTKNPFSLESCMIGVQVYESTCLNSDTSNTNRVLLTATQILSNPAMTWTTPCSMSLSLEQLPISNTLDSLSIKVRHHLRITVNYCSAMGKPDCFQIDCAIPLVAPPPSHPII